MIARASCGYGCGACSNAPPHIKHLALASSVCTVFSAGTPPNILSRMPFGSDQSYKYPFLLLPFLPFLRSGREESNVVAAGVSVSFPSSY